MEIDGEMRAEGSRQFCLFCRKEVTQVSSEEQRRTCKRKWADLWHEARRRELRQSHFDLAGKPPSIGGLNTSGR